MAKERTQTHGTLLTLLAIYAFASLLHFIHNAEFLADYPNLPEAWSREGIYVVWVWMTLVGVAGWALLMFGRQIVGLALLAVYAVLGLDSLGHYVLAPLSAHSLAMNATILLEVTAAALVLTEVARRLVAFSAETGMRPDL